MESCGSSRRLLFVQSILGLLTLSFLDPCYLCAGQGMNISDYCGVRTEPNVVLNCNNSKVIRVERVYFGATPSLKCPPPHNCGTFDVEETERLRVNCNRLPTCTTPANFPLVDCEGQRINSTSVYVTYQCVQDASVQLVALTSTTPPVLRPIVWLLTKHHPVEANDVYRQMCRIRTERPATVLIDFLDLSHDESATSESPYCIYWPGNHTCAERASSRQIFFVHNTLTASSFTLLFWSKNYSTTTTARFWIAITARRNTTRVSAECGLSVLDDLTVTTPEPYRLGEPGSAGSTSIVVIIIGTLVAVLLLVILVTILYVFLYRRRKNLPSDAAPTRLTELSTSQNDNQPRVDNVYMTNPGFEAAAESGETLSREDRPLPSLPPDGPDGQPALPEKTLLRSTSVPVAPTNNNTYDAIFPRSNDSRTGEPQARHPPVRSAVSLDPPQPTGPMYAQVMKAKRPKTGERAISSTDIEYDDSLLRMYTNGQIPSEGGEGEPHQPDIRQNDTNDGDETEFVENELYETNDANGTFIENELYESSDANRT